MPRAFRGAEHLHAIVAEAQQIVSDAFAAPAGAARACPAAYRHGASGSVQNEGDPH